MDLKTKDTIQWGESLGDFKPEYVSVKVWSPIQMYRLIGRRSVIALDNFEPIPCVHYALYSPQEKRYYLKEFPDVPLWLMMYYKTNHNWDSYDTFLNDFRRRVADKNVYLLLTKEQIDDTTAMLKKLYKANLNDDGKLDYKIYIKLVKELLDYEQYQDHGKNLTGYRTVCKGFDDRIAELWKSAHTNNKKL